jgi:hypothetical protein
MNFKFKVYGLLVLTGMLIFGIFMWRGDWGHKRTALEAISADVEAHDKPLGAPDTVAMPTPAQPAPAAAAAQSPSGQSAQAQTDLGAAVQAVRDKSAASNRKLEDSLKAE